MAECYDGCDECLNPICKCSEFDQNEDYINCSTGIALKLFQCMITCDQPNISGFG